ncbi:hypothetical protein D3C83_194020 [compost metagenome]
MRAPPLAANETYGRLSAMARAMPRANRSPTTEPMDPPMKANSKADATIGRPLSSPSMTTIASFSPVDFW